MGSVYGVEAFPLYWPEGWNRTKTWERDRGRYQVSFARAREDILAELEKLGARDVLISSNIPLRRDGLPYASVQDPQDTGIAVYWTEGPKDAPQQRVVACDCWQTCAANLRAVGLSIQAFNAIKRAGATQVLEQAFRGFTQLPPGPSWHTTLGVSSNASFDEAKRAFHRLIQVHHPDTGGSHEKMAEINAAFEAAKKHFKQAT
jgi:hypothetical protein